MYFITSLWNGIQAKEQEKLHADVLPFFKNNVSPEYKIKFILLL
jgi:hypothetical protein